MTFETIGYNGQFKNVIGDPATGFRMMVFGKPFQGKSSAMQISLPPNYMQWGKQEVSTY